MRSEEKRQISGMRLQHCSYKTIAEQLGIKESTVKSYCSRNRLTDKDISLRANDKAGCCQQCGTHIEQHKKQKSRRFCSDECRIKWWNTHRDLKQHKHPVVIHCSGCGASFTIYGKQTRKYCSHECYLNTRFGGDKS